MSNLEKRQTSLELLGIDPSKLQSFKSPAIRRAVEARNDFPVRSLLTSEIKEFVSDQIEAVAGNLGQKNTTEEIINAIMGEIPAELNRSFYNWTRQEISEAWRLGSLGQLEGDNFHLSARTLIQWLNAYEKMHRKPAFKKIRDLKALNNSSNSKTPKTEEMTREAKILALNEALELFRRNELKGYTFYYKLLAGLGLCKIADAKETWELIGRANFQILMECKEAGNNALTRDEARRRKNLIKEIEHGKGDTVPEFVLSRVKQLKVEDYFSGLPKDHVFK